MDWPSTAEALIATQLELAALRPPAWEPGPGPLTAAGCYVCFGRGGTGPGSAGDPGWAAACSIEAGAIAASATVRGYAAAPYEAGLLALREGPLLEAAIRALPGRPEVLLVNATGRDHPRGAGLALHLGAILGVPTVGVTHRPLVARGDWPPGEQGATAPLELSGQLVGYWVRTRRGTRPLVAHAGWRTGAATAARVLTAACAEARTATAIREARRLAREARAADTA